MNIPVHQSELTVSIIIPVWNTGEYLDDAVNSALGEIHNIAAEIIIVDDKSDDPYTLELLRELSTRDPIITVISNESGFKGAGPARNWGVRIAKGEWLIFLDSDDVLTNDGISKRLEVVQNNKELNWVAADLIEWNPANAENVRYYQQRMARYEIVTAAYNNHAVINSKHPVENIFQDPIPVATTTVMVKREAFNVVGGFSNDLEKTEDVFLWTKLALHVTGFAFIPDVVTKYRYRPDSLNHEDKAIGEWWARLYKLFYHDPKYYNYKGTLKRAIAKSYLKDSYFYQKKRSWMKMLLNSLRSMYWNPVRSLAWKQAIKAVLRVER